MTTEIEADEFIQLRKSQSGSRWMSVLTAPTESDLRREFPSFVASFDDHPALLMAFLTPSLALAGTLAELRQGLHEVPTIGCSSSGVVTRGGIANSAGQVIALGGQDFDVTTALHTYETPDSREAGECLARGCIPSAGPTSSHSALMLLTDGLHGDVAQIIRGAYRVTGAGVGIVGGCAGDDLAMEETFQFHDDRVVSRSAAAALLQSTAPIGIGVEHGWSPIGEPLIITASDGTSVLEIDDRPALDVYLERVDAPSSAAADNASFAQFAQTRPFGIRDQGSGHVRFVKGCDFERRSLEFLLHIDVGQIVWVMNGDRNSVIEATRGAVDQAVGRLDGHDPIGVIAFDCVARRAILGEAQLEDEVHALTETLPTGTPFGGYYTYGEIARTSGAIGLHHQTMVVMAIA